MTSPRVETKAAAVSPPEPAEEVGRVSEVRIAVPTALATAVAEFNAAPVALELPKVTALAALAPAPKAESWFRALLRRLWSRQ